MSAAEQPDYITWLSQQGWAQEAEMEALEATAELGDYGASMFDRYEARGFDQHLLDDPDEADWQAALAAERNHVYRVGIRGDKALEFLEGFGHVFEHDCAWGAAVVDEFVNEMYQALGAMMFDDNED